jgi:IS30 family transposase
MAVAMTDESKSPTGALSRHDPNRLRRARAGHWEADTVIAAGRQHAIVTLVEGKSGFAVTDKVDRKTSAQVSAAVIERLLAAAGRVKKITFYNDKGVAGQKLIDQSLGSTAYFADPFASW